MRRLWILCLPLCGCLLLAQRPAEPEVVLDCRCSDHRTCYEGTEDCVTYCGEERDCEDGYTCAMGDCVEPCSDRDCDAGLACDDLYQVCNTECWVDSDCRGGYHCCSIWEATDNPPVCDTRECTRN